MIPGGFHVNWSPLALAALLALLLVWLNQLADRVDTVDTAGFTHDPDYIVDQFDALAFDANGKPRHRLAADKMMHYMDDDTTVLDKPHFQSLDEKAAVEVRSKRALVSSDGKKVYFLNEVRAVQKLPGGGPPINLESEYLSVDQDARTLFTDRGMVMRQARSMVTADKLLIDDNARVISMEGKVRGTYERAR